MEGTLVPQLSFSPKNAHPSWLSLTNPDPEVMAFYIASCPSYHSLHCPNLWNSMGAWPVDLDPF